MEFFSEVQISGWQCCSCRPSLLQKLTLQLEKALDRVELIVSSSDSDSDTSDSDIDVSMRYIDIQYYIVFVSEHILSTLNFLSCIVFFMEMEILHFPHVSAL